MPPRKQTPILPQWVLAHPSLSLVLLFFLVKASLVLVWVFAPEATVSKRVSTLLCDRAPANFDLPSSFKSLFDIQTPVCHGGPAAIAKPGIKSSTAFRDVGETGFNWPSFRGAIYDMLHSKFLRQN
jgi:hypothetical protein